MLFIVGIVLVVVFFICFFIACASVEKTKTESIRIRELLENINKIQIALYKKEFNLSVDAPQQSKAVDLESVPKSALSVNDEQG